MAKINEIEIIRKGITARRKELKDYLLALSRDLNHAVVNHQEDKIKAAHACIGEALNDLEALKDYERSKNALVDLDDYSIESDTNFTIEDIPF